jgi:hypothetical protein
MVWAPKGHLDELLSAILENQNLNDVRVGFLDIEAMLRVNEALSGMQDRTVLISIHDFGFTHNCWVLELPRFRLESPTPAWQWKPKISALSAMHMCEILNKSFYQGQPLTKLEFRKCRISDEIGSKIMSGISERHLDVVDFSKTEIRSATIDSIVSFLEKDEGSIDVINVAETMIGMASAEILFRFIELNEPKCPRVINVSFESRNVDELGYLGLSEEIGSIISNDYVLEELRLWGNIGYGDVSKIVNKLNENSHLKILEIESGFFANYDSPDPHLPSAVQSGFDALIDRLHEVVCGENSRCVLQTFIFPLLTEVYLYNSIHLDKWPEITHRMEANGLKNS